MIIGINGKIGSGKDTIGKIAQCLINHPKVTNEHLLWMIENNTVAEEYSKCEIKKFAGKLKQIGSILSGIPVEMFEDQEFKKLEMPECWNRLQQSGRSKVWTPMTYREFLQKLGTEAMREGLHTNVWVNALMADYITESFRSDKKTNWIITDMRFPNEMEAVVEKGGITIRVVRYPKTVEQSRGPENVETIPFDPTNQKHMDLWKGDSSRLHPSETALDDHTMHYDIVNDGTIEDLIEKVREILTERNII